MSDAFAYLSVLLSIILGLALRKSCRDTERSCSLAGK